MTTIPYEDFAKLRIAIGTIVTAEVVEGADKLLRLTVDVGEETPRQIISGIRMYFTPEELVGTQCTFLVNLEPKVIRGFESQGMILAVRSGEELALLRPTIPVPPGSAIS